MGQLPDWCFWDYPLIELEHKTIGIIGFGHIGQSTGRIAKALGMRVLAYDVHPNDAAAPSASMSSWTRCSQARMSLRCTAIDAGEREAHLPGTHFQNERRRDPRQQRPRAAHP